MSHSLHVCVAVFVVSSVVTYLVDCMAAADVCWSSCCSMSSSVQNALSRSFNSYNSPLSRSHYTSCRDMHASQGSLVFGARDGQPCTPLGLCVSTHLEAALRARPDLQKVACVLPFLISCWEVTSDPQRSFTCPHVGTWKLSINTNPIVRLTVCRVASCVLNVSVV